MMVIRISEVIMQRSNTGQTAKSNQRKVQSSTTLNRKYVKRSPRISRFNVPVVEVVTESQEEVIAEPQEVMVAESQSKIMSNYQEDVASESKDGAMIESREDAIVESHPIQDTVNAKMRERVAFSQGQTQKRPKPTARELKDQAIQKALASAEAIGKQGEKQVVTNVAKKTKKSGMQVHFGFGKVMLALSCAAVAVFAIVYFVNLSMPDISLQVAAVQTGIDLSYPNYVPRDYSVSSITSEDGKVVIDFNNSANGNSFSLTEEKTSWDTNALASNYVKEEYGENYTIIREQGLTIYVSGSNAAWVNGGVVYKITANNGTLTNKQIRSIATSL